MFHVEHLWRRVAQYASVDLNTDQIGQLERYRNWLATEALAAGGIGPEEVDRLHDRHIADALLFMSQIRPSHKEIWDMGSGVGLPGIPLAIALADRKVTLIDRSGRRVRLAKRALRVLGLSNCSVVQADIRQVSGTVDVLVARASLPPRELAPIAVRHLTPDGLAVVAGSWVSEPTVEGWTTVEIPRQLLDQPVWLLKMPAP